MSGIEVTDHAVCDLVEYKRNNPLSKDIAAVEKLIAEEALKVARVG